MAASRDVDLNLPSPAPVMTQPATLLKDASMRQGATAAVPAAGDMRALLDRLAALLTFAAILGYVLVQKLAHPGVLNLATGVNTFFEQYRLHEPVFLALMAAFAIAAAVFRPPYQFSFGL